jgi:hypothetical protein
MQQAASESEVVGWQDLFVNKRWGNNLMLLKYCQSLNISVKSEMDDNLLQSSIPSTPLEDVKNFLASTGTQEEYCDAIRRCFYKRFSPSSSGGETDEVLFRRICERVSNGLGWSRSCQCMRAAPPPTTSNENVIAAFRTHFKKEHHLALLYQQIQDVFKTTCDFYAPSVSIY